MDIRTIDRILQDTAYVRTGGSEEELRCAEYLKARCEEMGIHAWLEDFEVPMSTLTRATLLCDGREITCKGYFCAGSADVEAPLYYLRGEDRISLSGCRDKIVLIDGYLRHWMYQDLLENGAVGFITYDGNVNYTDWDIDQRELRATVHKGNRIPGVNINAKDAIALIRNDASSARIILEQEEYTGHSRNVVAELPGESDEWIALTAHYDSTSLSQGSYDNMSGSVGLLGIAEHFLSHPHRRGLRFVWCGSEERGLLGSKAYVAAHEDSLKDIPLNVNLDMIGCIMGKFIACCTTEEKLVSFVEYFGAIHGFPVAARQDVYSSDSTPFADKGVPALSFARLAPPNTATIHNSYDTPDLMKARQLAEDVDFINLFVDTMANAVHCPVARVIPDNMKEKLDIYNARKRDKK